MLLVQLSFHQTPATTFEWCTSESLECSRQNAPLIQMMGKVCSNCCDFNSGKSSNFFEMWVSARIVTHPVATETGTSLRARGKPFIANRLGHL